MSAVGKECHKQARFGFLKAENRPIQAQKRRKLFISSKLSLWVLSRGSLPRGSLAAATMTYFTKRKTQWLKPLMWINCSNDMALKRA